MSTHHPPPRSAALSRALPATSSRAVPTALLAAALALGAGACATGRAGNEELGPTGLESALPGGDGRALRAYRAEYRSNVISEVDEVMRAFHQAWEGSEPDSVAALYSAYATVADAGGDFIDSPEGVRGWIETALPLTTSLNLWRDAFAASGEMAAAYGRYEAESPRQGMDQRGFHLTVTKREGREWKVRSQLFLAFEGTAPLVPEGLADPAPDHITPDEIRGRRGNAARARTRSLMSEWAVSAYWFANSVLAELRHAWGRDDFDEVLGMLAPDAVIRVPWDVPAVGVGSAERTLRRFLPAVADLHMTVVDFDASERLSYCAGRYVLNAPGGPVTGSYVAVIMREDDGPRLRALLLSGGGASAGGG